MAETTEKRHALGDAPARKLANTTKVPAQLGSITPRWLVAFLPWTPVEAGTYRVNRVVDATDLDVVCGRCDESDLPATFVDYEEKPREHTLSMVSTVLDVHTRVSDLFSSPHDQVREQLRLAIESVKERQEGELINNSDYGLLHQAARSQRIKTRRGPPTPDDLDELIKRVWKEPAFFLAHPYAVAAFGRECTRRGVPPATVSIFGSQFLTWRGLPIVPCDKLHVDGQAKPKSDSGKTSILLLRVGEKKRGITGLFQPGLPGEQTPGLSVRFMGINRKAIASYLITLYCSAAVLADDALGVLEDVEVGYYHDYR